MSLISDEQVLAGVEDVLDVLPLLLVEPPNICCCSTSENPMIAFSGVRSSCDMLARNSDLCRLARLELAVEPASSSFMRFRFTARAPSSSRFATSTCREKSPAAISASRVSVRWIGPINDQERTRPSSSARRTLAAPTATNRLRDDAYALRFWAIRRPSARASSLASWSVRSPSSLSALIASSQERLRPACSSSPAGRAR